MVRGHLALLAAALLAAPALAQAVPDAVPVPTPVDAPRPPSAARTATAPGADPAIGAAKPLSAKGKGKMAKSSMSKLMHMTTHDIMMPDPGKPALPAPASAPQP